jgi:hypothetical protein
MVRLSFPSPKEHLGGKFSTGSCQSFGTQHHPVEVNLQASHQGRDGRGLIRVACQLSQPCPN